MKLPYILAAISLVHASTLKGIAPDQLDRYQPSKDNTWTCLDGSQVIPFSAVNDDYCDCVDGSDEPGTSACPNSYFYCANKGHLPAYIKSSAVNDGVCDEACCDGSDETGGLLTHCPDRCQQVGQAYRAQQAQIRQATEQGLEQKQAWVTQAEAQWTRWQQEKQTLEEQLGRQQAHLDQLQQQVKTLESHTKPSKKRVCQSSVLDIATLKHDVTLLQREVNTLRQILSDLKRDHNHNYHDMAVKSAIAGYDEFVDRYVTVESDIEEDLKSIEAKEGDQFEEEEEEEEVAEEEATAHQGENQGKMSRLFGKLESILPNTLKQSVSKKKIDHETALEELRQQVQTTENDINRLNQELDKVKANLSSDYGSQKEWLTLKDVCIEKDEGEYTYSLCFLGQAHQKSNKDSTRTYLGQFEKFDGLDNLYDTHIHTRGTRCWNGPERSVKVTVECGVQNEIVQVSEPEKCEYHFHVISPAICQSNPTSSKIPIHEEL